MDISTEQSLRLRRKGRIARLHKTLILPSQILNSSEKGRVIQLKTYLTLKFCQELALWLGFQCSLDDCLDKSDLYNFESRQQDKDTC